MVLAGLTRTEWAAMSPNMQAAECCALAQKLQHGLMFLDIVDHVFAGKQFRVARFRSEDKTEFVLVPGGRVRVGHEPGRFLPTTAQQASYDESAEEYGLPKLHEFLEEQCFPARTVDIPATIVETVSLPIGYEEINEQHPQWDWLVGELESRSNQQATRSLQIENFTIMKSGGRGYIASLQNSTRYDQLCASLATDGFELLSSDAWEHACGAGVESLFRWGDDCPIDFYPGEASPEDRRRRREWALSGGKIAYDPAPVVWNSHEQPNTFGLKIADNPYKVDLVADGPLGRGGDGGCMICGGSGFFLGWLTLATAYQPSQPWVQPKDEVANDYSRLRRSIALGG